MHQLLTPLLHLQSLFIPAIFVVMAWAGWRMLFKKDVVAGLALYVGLLIVMDGFYNTGIYIPGVRQGSIKYSELCAFALIFVRPPAQRNAAIGGGRGALIFVGMYFFLLAVAALRASPMMTGIFDFRTTIFPQILAFALAVRGFQSPADYRRFMLLFGVIVLIVALFCMWDVVFDRHLLHSRMLEKPEYFMNRRHHRFGSLFLNPNFLGAFVVLVFPVMFMLLLSESARGARIYLCALLLGLLFCIVQTQSRAPMLALAAVIAMLTLGPAGISRSKRIAGLVVGLLILTLLMPGFFTRATGRFEEMPMTGETSMEEVSRASMWVYTRQLIAQNPVLGIGLGEQQFLKEMEKTNFRARFGQGSLDNPHNSYLQATVYAGIPALLAFIFANVILLSKGLAVALRPSNKEVNNGTVFGLTAGISGFLISIYPDMQLFTQHLGPLYWLFLGLLFAMTSQSTTSIGKDSH